MPAPAYIGSTETSDPTIGAVYEEAGILIGDSSYSVGNPQIEFLDRWGGVIGKATDFNGSVSISVSGEVNDGTTGVNAATFKAAATLANDGSFESATDTYHGLVFTSSVIALTEASGTQPRGGARTVDLTYMRHMGLVSI